MSSSPNKRNDDTGSLKPKGRGAPQNNGKPYNQPNSFGRGSPMQKSAASTKKTAPVPTRNDSVKVSTPPNPRPKTNQPESAPVIQPTPPTQSTPNQNDVNQPPNAPVVQPGFQSRSSYQQIPPRTHSAPPNLQEQERQAQPQPLFYPEKHTPGPFKGPYGQYGQPYYAMPGPSFPASMQPMPPMQPMQPMQRDFIPLHATAAPYMPGAPMNMNMNPQMMRKPVMQPPVTSPQKTSNILAIIDPDSKEEIVIEKPNPTTTNPPVPPQNTAQNSNSTAKRQSNVPGGILPELKSVELNVPASAPKVLEIMDPEDDKPPKKDVKQPEKPQKSDGKAENAAETVKQEAAKHDKPVVGEKEPKLEKGTESVKSVDTKVNPVETVAPSPIKTDLEKETSEKGSESEERGSESEGENDQVQVNVLPPKKHNLKHITKKAEAGNYKAMTFDAFSAAPRQEDVKKQEEELEEGEIFEEPLMKSGEDDREEESEEDDWENKDEDELMNLRKASPFLSESSNDASAPQFNFPSTLSYPVGTWSPENTSGNMIYDRVFLTQFQNLYKERPTGLPEMSEILGEERSDKDGKNNQWRTQPQSKGYRGGDNRLRNSNSMERSSSGTFSPAPGRRGNNTPSMNRQNSGNRKSSKPRGQPEIVLVATPGRWETGRNKDAEDKEKQILTVMIGLLNKLTEKKFDETSDEMINIGKLTPETLKGIIKLIFDKALSEPKFGKMYAELCKKLAATTQYNLPEAEFKRLLLNRCQEEFESSFKKTRKDTDAPLTEVEKLQQEEQEMLDKKTMLGNITFIGELYKARMLTEKIMHECIKRLLGDLKNPANDDIEALCRLMTSIGQQIDHDKARNYVDQYFVRMKELSRNMQLPSRIRFGLQDVIELRNNRWVKPNQPPPSSSQALGKTSSQSQLRNSSSSQAMQPPSKPPARTLYNPPAPKKDPNEWEVIGKSKTKKFTKTPEESKPANEQSKPQRAWKENDRDQPKASSPPPKSSTNNLSPEELEEKIEILVKDYLETRDFNEALDYIRELDLTDNMAFFVERSVLLSFDKSSDDRDATIRLFGQLNQEEMLSDEHFVGGLTNVMTQIEDMILDLPDAVEYLGTFIGNAAADGYLSFGQLVPLLSEYASNESFSILDVLVETFNSAVEKLGVAPTRNQLRKSKLDLMRLMPKDRQNKSGVAKFLREHDLSELFPQMTYGSELEDLVHDRKSNDDILRWAKRLPEEVLEDVSFCRTVYRTLLEKVIVDPSSPTKEQLATEKNAFVSIVPLLKELMASEFNVKLNTLFETQKFCMEAKFPSGLIERIFDYLHGNKIVSAEVFSVWSEDETFTEGKQEALDQTSKWLSKHIDDKT